MIKALPGIPSFLLILIFLSPAAQAQITYNGKTYFLNGPNIAWNNYGWDFGMNSYGWTASGQASGYGYDPTWWENAFTQIQAYGGNSVRVWVHCKGELNPLFSSGTCTGLNTDFFTNMDDMFLKAGNHNLMVILCLWDFHITDVGRQDVITTPVKTTAYINNALIPIVQHYATQCNLLAYEIFNEPEWIMSGVPGGGTYGGAPVSVSQMQAFVGKCAEAIHNNSGKMVTVGSACLKWCSDVSPATGNYWKDAAIQAAYTSPQAYLDFYQVHYYDWMAQSGNDFSPYNRALSHWGLNKPVLIGESGNTSFYNYQQQFDNAYSNGYAGTMIWAYASGGAASWSQFNSQMQTFRNAHTTLVDFTGCAACTTPTASISAGGPTTFCSGGNVVLTAGNGTGYTYQWKSGGSNISGATSINYTASTAASYTVTVTSGACSATSSAVNVTVDLPPSSSIAGADQYITSTGTTLTANTPVTGTGAWSVVSGSAIFGDSSSGTSSVTGLTAGANTLRWTISNGTCSSVYDDVLISVGSIPASSAVSGPATVQTGQSYTFSVPADAQSTFNWTVPAGMSITGGQGSNSVTVLVGAGTSFPATISLDQTNNYGTTTMSKQVSLAATTSINKNLSLDYFTISPNPFNSEFIIRSNTILSGNISLRLIDMRGYTVYSQEDYIPGTTAATGHEIKAGLYILLINYDDKIQIIRLHKTQ